MALRSSFFNAVNGDRRYLANHFAEYFASFIANGIFPNPSNGFQIYEKKNMTIVVKPGKGWINGYFVINEFDYEITLDNADGVLNRIDRIALRLDFNSRSIEIVVKKGVFASSPVARTLQRDADAYEIVLGDIYITKGVTAITQAKVTDQRLNTALCGIVHGLIDQVDTSSIFNQYVTWFTNLKNDTTNQISTWQDLIELEFNEWFSSVKNILDGDVATNLATRIIALEKDLDLHKNDNTKHFYFGECGSVDSESIKNISVSENFILKNGTRLTVFFLLGKAGTVTALKINELSAINLVESIKLNDMFVTFIYQSGKFYLLNKQQQLVGDLSLLKTSDKTTLVNAMNETIEGTGWQTPVLLNGFTDVGASRYKKIGNTLHLTIAVNGTTFGASVPIFNLPSDYRPGATRQLPIAMLGSSLATRGQVSANGDIFVAGIASEMPASRTGYVINAVIPL